MDHLRPVTDAIRHRLQAGMMSFREFQELALYGPDGFFTSAVASGRDFHFLTSPALGDAFGTVLARALDDVWTCLGRPEAFDVIECGAGDGSLARSILSAQPACSSVLQYTLVERSSLSRSMHADRLAGLTGWTSTSVMPARKRFGVVVANELLDNLPVELYEWRDAAWREVCVGMDAGGAICEVYREPTIDVLLELEQWNSFAESHSRVARQSDMVKWAHQASRLLGEGVVWCFDYTRTSREMLCTPQPVWLRTYRNHLPGRSPLRDPGKQDITCDVAVDQLEAAIPGLSIETQADFCRRYGLAREADLPVGGFVGAMSAQRAEVRALLDPEGLGGFSAMTWHVDDVVTQKSPGGQ